MEDREYYVNDFDRELVLEKRHVLLAKERVEQEWWDNREENEEDLDDSEVIFKRYNESVKKGEDIQDNKTGSSDCRFAHSIYFYVIQSGTV